MRSKTVQVFLKINDGIWTRKIFIPSEFLHKEYRIPLTSGLNMHAINLSQEIMSDLAKTPVLVFFPSGEEKNGVPVLNLIRTENF